jgi:methylmalonyl-CoA/ethylmalonyl-CoA epimerase
MDDLSFHHIGYAVKSIVDSKKSFESFGYTASAEVNDEVQRVKVCFLFKTNHPILELVQGLQEKESPVSQYLEKNGVTPYHLCYSVSNIYQAVGELRQKGFLVLFEPTPAVALNQRKICYLFNKHTGLIELVENEISNI